MLCDGRRASCQVPKSIAHRARDPALRQMNVRSFGSPIWRYVQGAVLARPSRERQCAASKSVGRKRSRCRAKPRQRHGGTRNARGEATPGAASCSRWGGDSGRPESGRLRLSELAGAPIEMVGAIGLEPTTPTMSRWCSNQLSYAPAKRPYFSETCVFAQLGVSGASPPPCRAPRASSDPRPATSRRPAPGCVRQRTDRPAGCRYRDCIPACRRLRLTAALVHRCTCPRSGGGEPRSKS